MKLMLLLCEDCVTPNDVADAASGDAVISECRISAETVTAPFREISRRYLEPLWAWTMCHQRASIDAMVIKETVVLKKSVDSGQKR